MYSNAISNVNVVGPVGAMNVGFMMSVLERLTVGPSVWSQACISVGDEGVEPEPSSVTVAPDATV